MKRAQVRELWESRLAEYTQPGMDITTWCMANNISDGTFQYWRKKLVPTFSIIIGLPVTFVEEAHGSSHSGVII